MASTPPEEEEKRSVVSGPEKGASSSSSYEDDDDPLDVLIKAGMKPLEIAALIKKQKASLSDFMYGYKPRPEPVIVWESESEVEGDDGHVYPTYDESYESDDDEDYKNLSPCERISKAITNNNVTALLKALAAANVKDVDSYDLGPYNMNPLELACFYNSVDCVEFLLTVKNASISGSRRAFVGTRKFGKPESWPIPPSHIAIMRGKNKVLYYLIKYATAEGLLAELLGVPTNGSAKDATILRFACTDRLTLGMIMDKLNSLPNPSDVEDTNDAEANLSKKRKLEVTNDAEANLSKKLKLEVTNDA